MISRKIFVKTYWLRDHHHRLFCLRRQNHLHLQTLPLRPNLLFSQYCTENQNLQIRYKNRYHLGRDAIFREKDRYIHFFNILKQKIGISSYVDMLPKRAFRFFTQYYCMRGHMTLFSVNADLSAPFEKDQSNVKKGQ